MLYLEQNTRGGRGKPFFIGAKVQELHAAHRYPLGSVVTIDQPACALATQDPKYSIGTRLNLQLG